MNIQSKFFSYGKHIYSNPHPGSICSTKPSMSYNFKIENQKEHHQENSFQNEYIKLLRENEGEFDERYIFKTIL